jgi:WXG100 family type VII secretion target
MAIRYETLQQAHDDLNTAYQAVYNTVHELELELHKSLHLWTGHARDAYGPVKAQWDSAVADMAAVLAKAYKHLAAIGDNYQAAERQNVSIWTT